MHKRFIKIIAAASAALAICGCGGLSPVLDTNTTPPPPLSSAMPTQAPVSTSPETDIFSPLPIDGQTSSTDALGNTVYDAGNHYKQYILIKNVRVYEENGGTFIDCTVENSYPEPIVCALTATFYDENGDEAAYGSLQMGDGSFLLMLQSGSTPLYAHILTDTVLTDLNVEFAFDPSVNVKPYQAAAGGE